MEFIETALKGAFLIRQKKIEDHRGYFARAWCREEFIQHGLNPDMLQLNTAFSFLRGTVRGMHYQEKPHEEAKLIRCTRGAIYDVIIDLRPDSPTCGQWHGEELTGSNGTMLYAPEAARGVRYDAVAFGILWPLPVKAISDQDRKWPDNWR